MKLLVQYGAPLTVPPAFKHVSFTKLHCDVFQSITANTQQNLAHYAALSGELAVMVHLRDAGAKISALNACEMSNQFDSKNWLIQMSE